MLDVRQSRRSPRHCPRQAGEGGGDAPTATPAPPLATRHSPRLTLTPGQRRGGAPAAVPAAATPTAAPSSAVAVDAPPPPAAAPPPAFVAEDVRALAVLAREAPAKDNPTTQLEYLDRVASLLPQTGLAESEARTRCHESLVCKVRLRPWLLVLGWWRGGVGGGADWSWVLQVSSVWSLTHWSSGPTSTSPPPSIHARVHMLTSL